MLLFEGDFGNILHTGDCRLTSDCLQNLPLQYIIKKGKEPKKTLDYLFLDCTFGKYPIKIPSKHSAIQQVINCIWKHPSAPIVYLICDLLGQEEILLEVSRTFGSKIYIDKSKNINCFQALSIIAPHILSEDPLCRFQVCDGSQGLYERANQKIVNARTNRQPEPLLIRPSVQWYTLDEQIESEMKSAQRWKEAERDKFGVWHVCYSMHSSREELEWALQFLQPKRVVSTTPTCLAVEFNYFRNHCSSASITTDDSLWKLLNISPTKPISLKAQKIPELVSGSILSSAKCELLEHTSLFANNGELKFYQSSTEPITLFGQARLGILDSSLLNYEKKTISINTKVLTVTDREVACVFPLKENGATGNSTNDESKYGANAAEKGEQKSISISTQAIADKVTAGFSSLKEKNAVAVEKGEQKSISIGPRAITDKVTAGFLSLVEKNADAVEKGEQKCRSISTCVITNKVAVGFLSLEEKTAANNSVNRDLKHGENRLKTSDSSIGSSRSFNPSLRKFYRSMNVPVPRPLPSLTELINVAKRAKTDSDRR